MGSAMQMHKPDDSQTCTPGANNTLYVNRNNLKKILSSLGFICRQKESRYFSSTV